MNARPLGSTNWIVRLLTFVAVIPLAYWFVATAYALFFIAIAPWWALPLTTAALAIQLKGFAIAKAQSAKDRPYALQKAMVAYAAASWAIIALFIVLAWK